jgi:putative endonuclease
MNCYVYVLGSDGGRAEPMLGGRPISNRRLDQHNSGVGAKSTRGRTWVLLYAERYDARSMAMSREWQLKRDRQFRKLLWPEAEPD